MGLVIDENICLTPELVGLFTANWSTLVTAEGYQATIAQPFYHLSNEKKDWWRLVPNPGCEIWIENAGSMHSFRNLTSAVDHAEIDVELAVILSQARSRTILREAVLQKYFPEQANTDLSRAGDYFQKISNQIINEDPGTYAARIRQLKERMSGDVKQRELFQQEIYIRGGAFKRDVPKYYGYTCSISGLKIDATFNVSMIDACHIVPFSRSYNDTISNGIALCPNLHRAFDRGMIAVDENHRVLVSKHFTESTDASYSIKKLGGTSILLPEESRFHPLPENLEWHRKHIFKG
ncbi:HNH endonuclease [Telluribacter humicola]|uniref:HNH endonuclease n=1 Tax=Telluribacter humicola TaxID=1720261 RepID=UPI001A95CB47|nr:HNH endonuclease [Telluribacter humicola]